MKKVLCLTFLMVAVISPAVFARVNTLIINGPENTKYTGTLNNYEFTYINSEVIVRLFGTENGTKRKIQATFTFQTDASYTPNPQMLINALSNQDTNYVVEVNSPVVPATNDKVMCSVIVGMLRPRGNITISTQ